MSARLPPSFVPTLTEVVPDTRPSPATPPPLAGDQIPLETAPRGRIEPALDTSRVAEPAVTPSPWAGLEDQLVQRVLQRVDVALERRLHEALADVIATQTRSLLPGLRERIELVVRRAINDAVAQEMDGR